MKALLRALTGWLQATVVLVLAGGCASREPLATVNSVDIGRYSGRWHEIARYPNFFQRPCESDVTAEYSPLPDGSIRVVNSCRGADGRTRTALGRATVVPGSQNAKLKVRFGGPIAGDYWIIGLDEPGYRWALVGHPSRKFLWVLARDPALPPETYSRIVAIAQAGGFDPDRLVPTPQSGGGARQDSGAREITR